MMGSVPNHSQKSINSVRFANSIDDMTARLRANSYYHIFDDGANKVYATTTVNNIPVVIKAGVSGSNVNLEMYSPVGILYPLIEESLQAMLTH